MLYFFSLNFTCGSIDFHVDITCWGQMSSDNDLASSEPSVSSAKIDKNWQGGDRITTKNKYRIGWIIFSIYDMNNSHQHVCVMRSSQIDQKFWFWEMAKSRKYVFFSYFWEPFNCSYLWSWLKFLISMAFLQILPYKPWSFFWGGGEAGACNTIYL